MRDLATAPARGITQPRTNLIREPCICFEFWFFRRFSSPWHNSGNAVVVILTQRARARGASRSVRIPLPLCSASVRRATRRRRWGLRPRRYARARANLKRTFFCGMAGGWCISPRRFIPHDRLAFNCCLRAERHNLLCPKVCTTSSRN